MQASLITAGLQKIGGSMGVLAGKRPILFPLIRPALCSDIYKIRYFWVLFAD
jgi:hypothetical protein